VDYRLFWLTSGAFPLLAGVLVALNFRREPPQTGDSTHPGPP
jgi:hypothetical protein